MIRMRLFFVAILCLSAVAAAQTTQTAAGPIHKNDLLAAPFVSRVYGIQFSPPLNCTQVDKTGPDTIVEFDRDDYNWQLRAWRVRLERSLPLTIHKDQFGRDQDGVVEVTLANIQQQTPGVQVLRNEVINVGRVRVGMIAVRYETATHDRRFTQQAIIEAPDADHQLYYFLDLTGPGKPQSEPEDVINPAEKAAFDAFSEVVDSVVLLDRSNILEDQRQRLYHTMGLFVLWGANNASMVQAAIVPERWQRIIKDGQDIGYQYVVEEFEPRAKSPGASLVHIGVRSHMMPTPLEQWDTETWMVSSIDLKHEDWHTSVRCTNNKGELVDSYSQVGASDEQTKAVALQASPNTPDGALMPDQDNNALHQGPLGQGNVDIVTVRSLQATTTRQKAQLSPFKLDVPAFYVPQAFGFMLPELLPLKPKGYMFATFVPSNPQNGGVISGGNVMSRYMDVQQLQHVKFHGQEFDAFVITDKITLEGSPTTYFISPEGKFLGSTSTFPEGDHTTTVEVVPTDSQTLQHIWLRPDLSRPEEQPGQNPTDTPGNP
jgi:hypothetical protein